MNAIVKELFLNILDMSYAGGWLMAAVILTRLLLRKAPRWMICLLWGLVALRLICPFSLESTFSLIPEKELLSEVMVQEPPIMTEEWQQNAATPAYTYTGMENAGVEKEVKPADPVISIMDVLAFVWAAGVVLMLAYGVVSYYRIKKRTDISMNVRDNIYQCDTVDTPFILGTIHPRIFVPSMMEDCRMEYVVAHEKAHIRRGDHLWKPLGFVILCVYWFHPLCWISYILLCRDIELACDEYVVSTMALEDKKLYAEALLSCSINKKLITVCPLAFGEVGVKERIKSILHYKKPAFWVLVISAMVCVIVAVCFLTSPGGKKEELPVGPPEEGDSDENFIGHTEVGNEAERAELLGQTLEQWAQAFVNRDGQSIVSLASDELVSELLEEDLLMGSEGQYSFGISSPWPWDDDYDIFHYADNNMAEIYYYARTSDPHIYFWREMVYYEWTGDQFSITGSELTYYDSISSGAEYAEAYRGRINGTMIDYTWNQLGEMLNDNAFTSDNDAYSALFSPEEAAVFLLNLSTDPEDVKIIIHEGEEEKGMMAGLDILFLQDQYTVTISMIQPYGMNGIWVPADYRTDVLSRFMSIEWEEIESIQGVGFYDSTRRDNIICIGEIPEHDIRAYGYNDEEVSGQGVAIDIAGDVNYFDWNYTSPRWILPDMYWNEEPRELQMSFHTFTGTGADAQELVVMQQYDTGTLAPYYFGFDDYREILNERIGYSFDIDTRKLTLTDRKTGQELAEIMVTEGEVTEIECGMISGFTLGETITFYLTPGYFLDVQAIPEYEDMPVLEFEVECEWGIDQYGGDVLLFDLGDLIRVN